MRSDDGDSVIVFNGEVYVTWYDNQIDGLMQVKSTDHGHTFTPARPIATITGVYSGSGPAITAAIATFSPVARMQASGDLV